LTPHCAELISRTVRRVLESEKREDTAAYKTQLVENFKVIKSKETIKEVLNIYGNCFEQQDEIEQAINGLRVAIGSLPITLDNRIKTGEGKEESSGKPKAQFKTKVLEDGSYLT
jgi:hypothetical protein